MKLEEFVKQSLLEITRGVVSAMETADVTIAPSAIEGKLILKPQDVQFDLAITESKDAGGGLNVLGIGEAKAGIRSEHINKISFSVPVHFNSENVRNLSSRKPNK